VACDEGPNAKMMGFYGSDLSPSAVRRRSGVARPVLVVGAPVSLRKPVLVGAPLAERRRLRRAQLVTEGRILTILDGMPACVGTGSFLAIPAAIDIAQVLADRATLIVRHTALGLAPSGRPQLLSRARGGDHDTPPGGSSAGRSCEAPVRSVERGEAKAMTALLSPWPFRPPRGSG
jgi:hypothetical protein